MNKLTDDMIRITSDAIGANGRAVQNRNLVVYIGHHALKDKRGRQRRFESRNAARAAARAFIAEHNQTNIPACVASMGCLCAGHARGNPVGDACDASEVPAERWTRQGCTLSYDGAEAINVSRIVGGDNGKPKLSPTTCDAIADYVCCMLNTVDVDALTRVWMRDPSDDELDLRDGLPLNAHDEEL